MSARVEGTVLRRGYRLEEPAALKRELQVGYLAALLRIAGIDGVSEEQGRFVERAAADLGLDAEGIQQARERAGDASVPTERFLERLADGGLKACLVRDAYLVAAVDGDVAEGELEALESLADALGVGAGTVEAVRSLLTATPPGNAAGGPAEAVHAVLADPGAALAHAIRHAPDVAALVGATGRIQRLGRDLIAHGTSAPRVTRTLSALNAAVSLRVIELTIGDEGRDDLDLCWISLGSEGRQEQTLATDQDNGLIFEARGRDPEPIRARLLPVAQRINERLAECGFPLCKGQVMAGNPAWCASEEEWRDRFARWIRVPDPEALLNATIFFDLRPLWGAGRLARTLQAYVADEAPRSPRFTLQLARNALGRRPPLGFFRDFSVERGGEFAGTIDLKLHGVALFVDAARVYGLATGAGGTGTEERLREGARRAAAPEPDVEAWIEAFHLLQVLRLEHQYRLLDAGNAPHNHLDPYALNPLQQRFLREALRQAERMRRHMERTFANAGSL